MLPTHCDALTVMQTSMKLQSKKAKIDRVKEDLKHRDDLLGAMGAKIEVGAQISGRSDGL